MTDDDKDLLETILKLTPDNRVGLLVFVHALYETQEKIRKAMEKRKQEQEPGTEV